MTAGSPVTAAPSSLLTDAADRLDALAKAAIGGPWDADGWEAWIAAMGPQVAAPLAAWLRWAAASEDRYARGGIAANAKCSCEYCQPARAALAFARAFLRTEETSNG